MKARIATAFSLLLALSTAVAGTLVYSHQAPEMDIASSSAPVMMSVEQTPSPERLAALKASSRSAGYINMKLPI